MSGQRARKKSKHKSFIERISICPQLAVQLGTSHYYFNFSYLMLPRIVFGIYTIGSLTGALPASYLPDKFGRRFSMFCGNFFIIVGSVVTANARNKSMFIGGRFLTGEVFSLIFVSQTLSWQTSRRWFR